MIVSVHQWRDGKSIDDHKTYSSESYGPTTGQPQMTAIPANVIQVKEEAA